MTTNNYLFKITLPQLMARQRRAQSSSLLHEFQLRSQISNLYLCTAPCELRAATIAKKLWSARCPSNGPWCHSLPLFPSHWLEPSRIFPVSFPRRRTGSSMAQVLMAAAIAAPPAARPSPLPLPPWALSPAPPFPPPALLGCCSPPARRSWLRPAPNRSRSPPPSS